jgi:hypothetical protein
VVAEVTGEACPLKETALTEATALNPSPLIVMGVPPAPTEG